MYFYRRSCVTKSCQETSGVLFSGGIGRENQPENVLRSNEVSTILLLSFSSIVVRFFNLGS